MGSYDWNAPVAKQSSSAPPTAEDYWSKSQLGKQNPPATAPVSALPVATNNRAGTIGVNWGANTATPKAPRYNSNGEEIDENGNVVRDPVSGLPKMDPSRPKTMVMSQMATPQLMTEANNPQVQFLDRSVAPQIQDTTLSDLYRQQAAAAAGAARASNVGSSAANAVGQQQQQAQATVMQNAANTAALPASAPTPVIPPVKQPTDIPYATYKNIQDYRDPLTDKLIASGSRAIQGSAASRGMLKSSGTIEDIGDWAVGAESNAQQQAMSAFIADRTGMYDIFKDQRDFDYNNYKYQNDLSLGLYSAEKDDYQKQLSDWYSQMLGLSKTGENAANNASDLTTGSATAMANLFMAMAQMQSQGGVAQAQNQSSFMGDLFKMLPMLMSAGG